MPVYSNLSTIFPFELLADVSQKMDNGYDVQYMYSIFLLCELNDIFRISHVFVQNYPNVIRDCVS